MVLRKVRDEIPERAAYLANLAFALQLCRQEPLQKKRAVVFGVAGSVEKRDGTTTGGFEDGFPAVGIGAEFGEIALLKFRSTFHAMFVPLAQLRARRDVF